ncbi:DgyrCDS993 [Dimorphilus gyrociliatus]|uniref:DgyrCDS993 n=1 Tax=Dimorphilus gyrociliatus TaxID=2664684 RepID=A0A7I8V5X3_9ANNE|nr:DgyrCDS993 [Dimorphilus gyrociliatus]
MLNVFNATLLPASVNDVFINDNEIIQVDNWEKISSRIQNFAFGKNEKEKLEELNLADNLIENVEKLLIKLYKVRKLNLSQNNIKKIGKNLFNGLGMYLEELTLDSNKIVKIEERSFERLHNLRLLSLNNNKLLDLNFFHNRINLQQIFLENNNIEVFNANIQTFKKLQKLSLRGNHIKNVDEIKVNGIVSVFSIDLSKNRLKQLPKIDSHRAGEIEIINFNGNLISNISKISSDARVRNIDLSDNQLTDLPTFQTKIDTINVKGNHIGLINCGSLDYIKNVNLEENCIETIKDNGNSSIFLGISLNLRNNLLSLVPSCLDKYDSIDIRGNPLECNCHLLNYENSTCIYEGKFIPTNCHTSVYCSQPKLIDNCTIENTAKLNAERCKLQSERTTQMEYLSTTGSASTASKSTAKIETSTQQRITTEPTIMESSHSTIKTVTTATPTTMKDYKSTTPNLLKWESTKETEAIEKLTDTIKYKTTEGLTSTQDIKTLSITKGKITTEGKRILSSSPSSSTPELTSTKGKIDGTTSDEFSDKTFTAESSSSNYPTSMSAKFTTNEDNLKTSTLALTSQESTSIGSTETLSRCPITINSCKCQETQLERNIICKDIGLYEKVPTFLPSSIIYDEIRFLGNSSIRTIQRGAFRNIKVKSIYLQQNECENIEEKAFEGVGKYLLNLTITMNAIKNIRADALKDLKKLYYLDLSNNSIDHIEKEAFNHALSVRKIDLSHNSINSIEETLFNNSTFLNSIDLSYNNIQNVTMRFKKLILLTTLKLSNNLLTDLRDEMIPTSVKDVDLSGNKITSINSAGFSSSFFLKKLNLSSNGLKMILPGAFDYLSYLTLLDLSNNRIENIPLSVFSSSGLGKLQTLILRNNSLANLKSNMFNGLKRLENLALSYNGIKRITSQAFNGLDNLLTIDLSHNLLEIVSSTSLRSVSILKVLDLSHNRLTDINGISRNTYLERIFLSYNNITKLNSLAFDSMMYLKEITLDHNQLQTIVEKTFYLLLFLERIDLSSNRISTIEYRAIDFCDKLMYANFSHNKISSLIDENDKFVLESLQRSLTTLDLSNNKLGTIPDFRRDFTKLTDLKLLNNQWICDCKLGWIRSIVDRINLDMPHCEFPTKKRNFLLICYEAIDEESCLIKTNPSTICLETTVKAYTEFETTRMTTPKMETTKLETTITETAKKETTELETTRMTTPKMETTKIETTITEAAKIETTSLETTREETTKMKTGNTVMTTLEITNRGTTKMKTGKMKTTEIPLATTDSVYTEFFTSKASKLHISSNSIDQITTNLTTSSLEQSPKNTLNNDSYTFSTESSYATTHVKDNNNSSESKDTIIPTKSASSFVSFPQTSHDTNISSKSPREITFKQGESETFNYNVEMSSSSPVTKPTKFKETLMTEKHTTDKTTYLQTNSIDHQSSSSSLKTVKQQVQTTEELTTTKASTQTSEPPICRKRFVCPPQHLKCSCPYGYRYRKILCESLGDITILPYFCQSDTFYTELNIFGDTCVKKLGQESFNSLILEQIRLENICIEEIEDFAFKGSHSFLQELRLRNNKIRSCTKNTFGKLHNLNYLDLNNNRMDKLDSDCFKYLGNLEKLKLGYNFLQDLPTNIFKWNKNLKEIDLSHNLLTTISEGTFNGSCSLSTLDLSMNNLETLSRISFTVLADTLESLQLGRNNLKSLPKEIFNGLTKLNYLDLSDNFLSEIDDSHFSQIINLNTLNIQYNLLEEIRPAQFESTNQLQILNLERNKISTIIPRTFIKLNKLRTLNLKGNMIEHLRTESFIGLKRLNTLDLSFNRLRSLPLDFFSELHNLELLTLSNNKLKEISNLTIPGNLSQIWLEGNLFDDVPSLFKDHKILTQIHLAKNNIKTIPYNGFSRLPSLYSLNLANNKIEQIDSLSFNSLNSLRILNLSDNNLGEVPTKAIENLTSLTSLFLERNNITFLKNESFKTLKNLKVLQLGDNRLELIRKSYFVGLDQLTVLDVSDNLIARLDEKIFHNLKNVMFFNASGNNLKNITFNGQVKFYNIYTMDLSRNKLRTIPYKCFISLVSLKKLYLDFNELEKLDKDAFLGLTYLDSLSLSSNYLNHEMLSSFHPLRSLSNLNLNRNSLKVLNDNSLPLSLISLQTLTMRSADLQLLSNESISKLKLLRTLDLGQNNLTDDSIKAISSLASLRNLHLDNNLFRKIEFNIGFQRLMVLNLSNNHLESDKLEAISKMRQLQSLTLSYNDLTEMIYHQT